MTLTEALAILHKAGKVRNPWPPGVRVIITDPRCLGPDSIDAGRIVASSTRGIQNLEWEVGVGRKTFAHEQVPAHFLLDLTDAATRGCLLELLREASGNPFCHADPEDRFDLDEWVVYAPSHGGVCAMLAYAPTEGEALAAALIALAGGA